MTTNTLYWEMTPSLYSDYISLIHDMQEAQESGDILRLNSLEDQFNSLPGCPAHKDGDRVVPVVVEPNILVGGPLN